MQISSLHNLHKESSMTFIEYHSNSHVKVKIHMLAGSRPKNTGLGKICSLQGTCNLIKTDKRVLILKLTFHSWSDLLKATIEKMIFYFFFFFCHIAYISLGVI